MSRTDSTGCRLRLQERRRLHSRRETHWRDLAQSLPRKSYAGFPLSDHGRRILERVCGRNRESRRGRPGLRSLSLPASIRVYQRDAPFRAKVFQPLAHARSVPAALQIRHRRFLAVKVFRPRARERHVQRVNLKSQIVVFKPPADSEILVEAALVEYARTKNTIVGVGEMARHDSGTVAIEMLPRLLLL